MISRSDPEKLRAFWETLTPSGTLYFEVFLSCQCKKDYSLSPNLVRESTVSLSCGQIKLSTPNLDRVLKEA